MNKMLMLASLGAALGVASVGGPALAHTRHHHHAAPAMGGFKLMGTMTGAAENPAADPDGRGTFMARINPGHDKICYTMTTAMIAAPTAAHIHSGAKGVNGPPVVMLDTSAGEHCTAIASDLAMKIMKDADGFYVNVHTADYPGGAIRAQLKKG